MHASACTNFLCNGMHYIVSVDMFDVTVKVGVAPWSTTGAHKQHTTGDLPYIQ